MLWQNLNENLAICLNDKNEKIRPYRHLYAEWWLMLGDRIAYASLDRHDLEVLRELLVPLHDHTWYKVILVSPLDAACSIELW